MWWRWPAGRPTLSARSVQPREQLQELRDRYLFTPVSKDTKRQFSTLNKSTGLTALTEVDTVVVDVCGEKQEAWQREAVLQTEQRDKQSNDLKLFECFGCVLHAGAEIDSHYRREPPWSVFHTACTASPGKCPSSQTSAGQRSTCRYLDGHK